jgi:hypothetical protein
MSLTPTTNFAWQKPDVGTQSGAWGGNLNTIFDQIDTLCFAIQATANAALPKAGGTMTGQLNVKTETMVLNPKGNISGAVVIDLSVGQYVTATVTSAVTGVTVSNPPGNSLFFGLIFEIVNGGIGFTWGALFKFPSAIPPTLTNPGTDIVSFVTRDNGATFRMAGFQKDVR